MSSKNSRASSRQGTPIPAGSSAKKPFVSRLEQQLANQVMILENKFVLVALVILSMVFLIIGWSATRQSKFCDSGKYGMFCKKCPENGRCEKGQLQCPENTIKTNMQCLEMTGAVNESTIAARHEEVQKIFAAGNRQLQDFKRDLTYLSEKDLIASILYNDEFVIKTINGVDHVLKRPRDTDPFVAVVLACICIVGLTGSIEAILHKKYKAN